MPLIPHRFSSGTGEGRQLAGNKVTQVIWKMVVKMEMMVVVVMVVLVVVVVVMMRFV